MVTFNPSESFIKKLMNSAREIQTPDEVKIMFQLYLYDDEMSH